MNFELLHQAVLLDATLRTRNAYRVVFSQEWIIPSRFSKRRPTGSYEMPLLLAAVLRVYLLWELYLSVGIHWRVTADMTKTDGVVANLCNGLRNFSVTKPSPCA